MKDQYKPKLKISHKIKFKQRLLKKRLAILAAVTIVALWAANFMTSKDTLAYDDANEMGEITVTSVCSHTPTVKRRWLLHNPNDFDIPVEWKITPNFQSGLMILKPGDNYLITNTIRGYNPIQVRWQDNNGEWLQTVRTSDGEACPSSGCYVSEVVEFKPTKRNDGSIIPINSRDPQKAIGPVDEENTEFVTLGFGGEIIMKFPQAVANGEGNDIKIYEHTPANMPCARYPERIMAFASQDGCNFVYLGEGCQDTEFDLGILSWAQYIKLIDISPLNAVYNNSVADGYDLEGISCLNGTIENPVYDNLTPGSPQQVIEYKPGKRKNGTNVHASRSNANLALGHPSMDDLAINFVALGFNGSITLKFDFTVFNNEGNDLMVIETSFGAPDCQSYSEEAYFEGSLDGINWTPLGTVCLDGTLDLGAMKALQYIRVTDRSPMSLFNNTADGYDLDGIMVLNDNCGESSQRRTFHDRNDIPDEINDAKVFPNPFMDSFDLEIEPSGINEKLTFKLYNYVGQEVLNKQFDVPASSVFRQQIDASHLKKGAYVGSIDFMGQRQSVKLIKN